jgi:hypothetical protein
MFSLQQNWRTRGQNLFCEGERERVGEGAGRRGSPNNVYTYEKMKNNKIKINK